jgi:hypothetical protein
MTMRNLSTVVLMRRMKLHSHPINKIKSNIEDINKEEIINVIKGGEYLVIHVLAFNFCINFVVNVIVIN